MLGGLASNPCEMFVINMLCEGLLCCCDFRAVSPLAGHMAMLGFDVFIKLLRGRKLKTASLPEANIAIGLRYGAVEVPEMIGHSMDIYQVMALVPFARQKVLRFDM